MAASTASIGCPIRAGVSTQLIDYKTGNAKRLRDLVRAPLEDVQLGLYAALLVAHGTSAEAISAIYLPLDESGAINPVEHPQVARSAQRMIIGIGDELARIRAGAALLALGEGQACEHCSARGLCRRDHWAAMESSA